MSHVFWLLQVVNPGEIIGTLDETAAKELGLQQLNKGQEKVKIYMEKFPF